MKAFILLALFAIGSQAFMLEDISKHIDALKDVGSKLSSGLIEKSKQVLSDLLGKTALAVSNFNIGRRDLSDVLQTLAKIKSSLSAKMDAHKEGVKKFFTGALDKLKALYTNMKNHKSLKSFNKKVDDVVDEHTKAQKRFLVSFDDIKSAATSALGVAKDIATSDAAKALAAQAAQAALAAAVGKRSILSDFKDFMAPHVTSLTDAVKGVGSTLKGHATNLWNTIKDQVSKLGQKLSGHIDTLKGHGQTILDHGKNALTALKSAVSDVLNQTLTNVQPAVSGIIDTGKQAAGTIANHVAGAVSGASTA